MIKNILFLFLIFFSLSVQAQKPCNCQEVLDFVSKEIETNSASFAHQVIESKRESAYKKHKKQLCKIAKKVKTEKECMGVIQFYLSFLRDAHQSLEPHRAYYPFTSFADSIAVKKFMNANVENYEIEKTQPKGLLGNWYYKNGSFAIQIKKNNKKGRKYIAALTETFRNKDNYFFASAGDLKIEFYKNYQKELYAIYWSFKQKPKLYKVEYNAETLKLGRNMIFYRDSTKTKSSDSFALPDSTYFEEISPTTNYLRIHTFDFENRSTIDSILLLKRDKLKAKNNLIIDVRNNGGGTDLSYYPLLPYIMDSKIYQNPIAASSIWVSKDNFDSYDRERYMYGVETREDSLQADREIETLKKHIGGFEPYNKTSSVIDSLQTSPKTVYIIQNQWCDSSTEGFILTAQQSGKVKTFGDNTSGMVSYGEWRELEIPHLPAWISMTQKKMIFYNDIDFEMIGIKPDVALDPKEEDMWIEKVKNEIEKYSPSLCPKLLPKKSLPITKP